MEFYNTKLSSLLKSLCYNEIEIVAIKNRLLKFADSVHSQILVLLVILLVIIVLYDALKCFGIGKVTVWPKKFVGYRKKADEDFIYNLEDCPICLEYFCDPVRLQCGHVYCLECIVTYGEGDDKMRCPVCRDFVVCVYYLEGYGKLSLDQPERLELMKKLDSLVKYHNSIYGMVMKNIRDVLKWHGYLPTFCLILLVLIYLRLYVYYFCQCVRKKNWDRHTLAKAMKVHYKH